MTTPLNVVRLLALSLAVAAPLSTGEARADSSLACAALSTGSVDARGGEGLQIARSEALYRFQQRPYLRIPEGVAVWVRAPRGMTAADLHNLLTDCRKSGRDDGTLLCVKGATVSVERSGGHYMVRVTSDERATALEIQRRAGVK